MTRIAPRILAVGALGLLMVVGCRTPPPVDPSPRAIPDARLAGAERRFSAGDYQAAVSACIDLARIDPQMPGLADLQARLVAAMTEERAVAARLRAENARAQMSVDVDERHAIPATYGHRVGVRGETGTLRTPPRAMQEALRRPVTVNLDDVDLQTFILAMGGDESINIVADGSLQDLGTFTIHAENTPLKEILDYLSRNLGVNFSVGENLIWVSRGNIPAGGLPLETRMYRLRKGLTSREREGEGEAAQIRILEAIDRLVPEVEGADHFFDSKAHVLLVRDTAENLAMIEDIIEELDISPPQIEIEARFISAGVGDLQELGIDWVLNSPLTVSDTVRVNEQGETVRVPKTQIAPASGVGFTPSVNSAEGLNMTFQGILTDPMFQAVLHALEQSGKSQTLSSPKVTTVNNESAMIRIGEDFRYFEEFDVQSIPSSVTDSGTQVYSSIVLPVGSPSLEELGISLTVTPSVGADRSDITLELVPEISEFVRYESYDVATSSSGTRNGSFNNNTVTNSSIGSVIRVPIFRRSRIETEVVVRSGETVVMGGLITSSQSDHITGVPILSWIPLFGKLFQRKEVEDNRQNLLIFVTATLLSESGDSLVPVARAGR
jgi:type IV pilus assembly protein PilQ